MFEVHLWIEPDDKYVASTRDTFEEAQADLVRFLTIATLGGLPTVGSVWDKQDSKYTNSDPKGE